MIPADQDCQQNRNSSQRIEETDDAKYLPFPAKSNIWNAGHLVKCFYRLTEMTDNRSGLQIQLDITDNRTAFYRTVVYYNKPDYITYKSAEDKHGT